MRPQIATQTGTGSSGPLVIDYYGRPELALQVDITSGSATWTVEQTLNDPSQSPTWFSHPDTNMVSQTVGRQGNYAYLPRAVRVTVNSGTGTVRLTLIQAGQSGV